MAEVSIVALIDGEGCEDESMMGYWGLFLWFFILIYCMMGQFVLCEEYFVPVLSNLGNRLGMSEDVQGATLLAVGSSSPELFTALLGALFYPDDNPGPGTNVGSAVFNMCCIIGFSAIAAPKVVCLAKVPLIRDSAAYLLGTLILYIHYAVITPHQMDFWESCSVTFWWVIYVIILYKTDSVLIFFNRKFGWFKENMHSIKRKQSQSKTPSKYQAPHLENVEMNEVVPLSQEADQGQTKTVALSSPDETSHNDEYKRDGMSMQSHSRFYDGSKSRKPTKSIVSHHDHETHGILFEDEMDPNTSFVNIDHMKKFNPENIHIIKDKKTTNTLLESMNNDDFNKNLENALSTNLDSNAKSNLNKGWLIVIDPEGENQLKHGNVDELKLNQNNHMYLRRRTLMEYWDLQRRKSKFRHDQQRTTLQGSEHKTLESHDKENKEHKEHEEHEEHDEHHGGFAGFIHKILYPWSLLFRCIIPPPEGTFTTKCIGITILMIIIWLGTLTFFVVDTAEKVGACLKIPGDLLGITLLAVGSSLPDCIASVLVARQGKLNMAVANAFGSNIFDVNLCVGFAFILGGITSNFKPIPLGTDDIFAELIMVAAGFQVLLWIILYFTKLNLYRWIGYVLVMCYAIFVVIFSVLYVTTYDPEGDL